MLGRFLVVALVGLVASPAAAETPLTHEVFGARVAPPPELAGLRVGMPAAEARRIAPKLVPAHKRGFKTTRSSVASMKFEVHLSLDYKTIDSFGLILPAHAGGLVTKAWGPGIRTQGDCSLWLDPATKVRALGCKGAMDPVYLVWFSTYGTFDTLLVKGKPAFGFEANAQLLGAKIDVLRKVYGTALVREAVPIATPSEYDLLLPLVEWEERTQITLVEHDGHVASFRLWLNWEPAPAKSRDELVRALEAAWGKGQPHPRYKEELYWFDPDAGRRVSAREDHKGFVIKVEPYLPVAKLLGDRPDRLGVETTTILGATWKELVKAYPQWIDPDDEHRRLWLPPTEWERGTAIALHFDSKDRVERYSLTTIEWGPDRKAVEALLAARAKNPRSFVCKYDDSTRREIRARDPRVVLIESAEGWGLDVGKPLGPDC
jgi:hypothetical protein